MKKGKRKEDLVANSKKLFIEALKASLGVLNPACTATNISRSCYYKWYCNDPEFKKAVDEVNEMSIDFVMTKLYEGIAKGNEKLIIFYLTHRGSRYSFKNSQEVVITNQLVEFKFPNLELNEQNDIIVDNLLEEKKKDEDEEDGERGTE